MGNRKQAFGCKMRMGKIVENDTEAPVLRKIFQCYLEGASFNEITDWLCEQPVRYAEDKLWNKNMVARILADKRYTGLNGYPELICAEDFRDAQEIRLPKSTPDSRTEVQKLLAKLSKVKVSDYIERSVLSILNRLIADPELVRHQDSQPTSDNTAKLQQQLDMLMAVQPIDEDKAKSIIFQIASEKYSQIDDRQYETVRLKRLFSSLEYMSELTAEILKSSVSAVLISHGKTSIQLKNGQIIEGVI